MRAKAPNRDEIVRRLCRADRKMLSCICVDSKNYQVNITKRDSPALGLHDIVRSIHIREPKGLTCQDNSGHGAGFSRQGRRLPYPRHSSKDQKNSLLQLQLWL